MEMEMKEYWLKWASCETQEVTAESEFTSSDRGVLSLVTYNLEDFKLRGWNNK